MKQFVIVSLFVAALAASVQGTLLSEEAHQRHVTNVAGSLHGLIRSKFKFLESLFGIYDSNDGSVPVNIGHAYASDYSNAKYDDSSARSADEESEIAKEKVFLVKVSDAHKQRTSYAPPPVVSHSLPQAAPQHVSHAISQAAPQVASHAVTQVAKYPAPQVSPQAAAYSVPHATSYVQSHAASYAAPRVASHPSYATPQVVNHAVPQRASYAAPHVANYGANYGNTYAAPQAVSHAIPQRVHYAAQASSPVSSYAAAPRTPYTTQPVVRQPAPQSAVYAAPHVPSQPAVYAAPRTATYAVPQVSNHGASYSAPQTTAYAAPHVSHAAVPTTSHVSQAPQNARGHGPGLSFKIEKVIQKPFGGTVAGHFTVNAGINHIH